MLKKWIIPAAALAGLIAPVALAAPAAAHPAAERAVFVQANDPAGNTITTFHRGTDGRLTLAGSYPTGGLGGTEVGAPLDALASQGSLVYNAAHHVLLAVNAGSDTVTVFRVRGARLDHRQVLASGGRFPTSVAVHGDRVYVLNAGGQGAVAGFRLISDRLVRLPGEIRPLGLGNGTPPGFLDAPGQVSVTRGGREVVVTTKAGNSVLVFPVRGGRLAAAPVATPTVNPVPFALTVDRHGDLLITEAGTSTVTAYRIGRDATLHPVGASVPDGQAALCWIQAVGGYYYGANAGSSSISSFRLDRYGHPVLVDATAAATAGGPIDMTASGGYLYVQNAVAGTVDGFRVRRDGSLRRVTSVGGLPQFAGHGMEGIAAN